MKHARRLGLAAVIATCFLAALPADAQAPSDISGAWKFKTDVLPSRILFVCSHQSHTKQHESIFAGSQNGGHARFEPLETESTILVRRSCHV